MKLFPIGFWKEDGEAPYSGLDIANYTSDNPLMVYSFRHINSNYVGPLIKVRRASDNATADYSASLGNFVDWAAIDTWAGGNYFLEKWYDQSGNNYHLEQLVLSKQPLITDMVTTISGTKVPFFNGTSNVLGVDAVTSDFAANEQSIYCAIEGASASFASLLSVNLSPTSAVTNFFRINRYGSTVRHNWNNNVVAGVKTAGKEHLYGYFNGTTNGYNINNGAFTASGAITGSNPSNLFYMGAGGNTLQYFGGFIAEVIWFDVFQGLSGGSVDEIRNDQNTTYSLY